MVKRGAGGARPERAPGAPLISLFLVYGLAFLATGLILGLQARLPFGVLPRRPLALLAAFAVVHGVAEWTAMGLLIADQVDPGCSALAGPTGATAITALSYGVLL